VECYVQSMNTGPHAIQHRIETIIRRQQTLLAAFGTAMTSGDHARQGEIQKELTKLGAEMQRLTDELRYADLDGPRANVRTRSRAPGKTMRELALDVADEIGVPVSPATISEFTQIITGLELPVSRFASLRRDEERSARRDIHARPAWVAPALSVGRFNALPRLLTSSAWEVERRLIGARSLRVIHLRTTLAFLHRFERFQEAKAPQTEAVESLMLRYARGVPGAVASGQEAAPDTIRQAVLTELNAIEPADLAERRDAAARLKKYSEQQQLWGLPSIIDGGEQGSVRR
jgi:hypothetical protein